MNDLTLKAVERANENTNLEEVVEYCKSKNMPAYIEIIMGLPEETLESFQSGIYKLIDDMNYHNYIGIYFMVALPNTPFGDPEYLKKYGIKMDGNTNQYRNWPNKSTSKSCKPNC